MTIYLNIGSNSGHRRALIERAVTALTTALPGRLTRSDIIETEPWGFDSPHPFLNIGLAIETGRELSPREILALTQRVERDIDPSPHRDAEGRYIDRAIDIDIIAVDSLVVDIPGLRLPHPHAHERDFVMRPLAQIAPGWRHPLLGLTASEIAYGKDK